MYSKAAWANRRKKRQEIVGEGRFHRRDVELFKLQDLRSNQLLGEYLYTSGMKIERISADTPARARIAQFADMSFVHTIVPEITVAWKRDELSRDRSLLLIVKSGAVEFRPPSAAICTTPGAYLLVPGDTPVTIHTSETTELVYVSIPAALIAEVLMRLADNPHPVPVPKQMFAPIYSFVASVCTLSVTESFDITPLQTAAKEIVRSGAQLVAGDMDWAEPTLFQSVMKLILTEYRDPKLNGEVLAKRLGVSVRTLQQAFTHEGSTIYDTIRRIRVSAAKQILQQEPRVQKKRLAHVTGFSSAEALNRALRAFT